MTEKVATSSTSADNEGANDDTTTTCDGLKISENGAQQLLQLMIQRGYFRHSDSDQMENDDNAEDGIVHQLDCTTVDTFEKFQQLSEKQKAIYVNPESESKTISNDLVTTPPHRTSCCSREMRTLKVWKWSMNKKQSTE